MNKEKNLEELDWNKEKKSIREGRKIEGIKQLEIR